MAPAELTTDRLLLRRWRESDLAPFADLNADPVVMELFPSTLTRGRSDQLVQQLPREPNRGAALVHQGTGLAA